MAVRKKPTKKPNRRKLPPIPKVDPLRQALARKAWGKHKDKTFREVVQTDLAWIHWLFRQKRKAREVSDPCFLTLALLCKKYPLGIDDDAERELAAGKLLPEPPEYEEDDADPGAADEDEDESEAEEDGPYANVVQDEDDEPEESPPHDPVAEAMCNTIAPAQGCFMYGVNSDLRDEVDLVRKFTKLKIVFLRPGNDPPGTPKGKYARLAVLSPTGHLCFLPDDIRFFFKSKKRGAMLDYPYVVPATMRRYSDVKPIVVNEHVVRWPTAADNNAAPVIAKIDALVPHLERTILLTCKGAWTHGYTSEDVIKVLRLVEVVLGLKLGVVWDKCEDGMCTGDSDLYGIEADGSLYEAPDTIWNFLLVGETHELPTREEMQRFLETRRGTVHADRKPIYVGDYNYVWEDKDHEDQSEQLHAPADPEPVRELREPGVPAVRAREGDGGPADVLPVPDVRRDLAAGQPGADQPTGEGAVDFRTDANGDPFREAGTVS